MNFKKITPTVLLLLVVQLLQSQGFTKGFGFVVGTNSDSRSVNIIDVNNDGLEDIFISNGVKEGQDDFLYINKGNKQFSLAPMSAINTDNAASVGASFGDFNNDGHIDAYVTNWYGQKNRLYKNDGTGKFIFQEGNTVNIGSFAETATWGDYDKDGWLDLYVTNSGSSKENYLFRNLQNGEFEQITNGPMVEEQDATRNANFLDINNDGNLDLFIANESNTANDMFWGNEEGSFTKNINGSVVVLNRSSMSSSWGDIDNDGDFDLFVANAGFYAEQSNYLFTNDGQGQMVPVNIGELVSNGGCSYGSNFGDYDNDGDLDLIVTNGFCNSKLKDWLFENQGDGTFIQRNELLQGLREVCSYGAAWGDLNNDGFLDLVIANCKNKAEDPTEPTNSMFYNKGNDNNWLKIRLEGALSNKSAIGTKVWAKAMIDGQNVWQARHVSAQSGYAGQNSLIVHFGLKDAEKVDSLKIQWPDGSLQYLQNIFPNQQLKIVENGVVTSNQLVEKEAFGMVTFPNPAKLKDTLQLKLLGTSSPKTALKIQLYNLNGQLIFEKTLSDYSINNTIQLPLSNYQLTVGTYQLSIEYANSRISTTLVLH